MAETIILVIFMIPFYGIMLWTYKFPEDSILAGKRWMYSKDPEISKAAIRYTKFASITTMVGLPIVILSFISKFYFLRLSIMVFFLMFIFGTLKIFTDDKDE
ncbi:hypothetical protein ACFFHH_24130 [Cytobacillus solani]|uniref:hypothetical protein n=1 Tax=Cytobacillus solani TaxID=1637975 RepID=UPI0009497B76|nr:hypothetical protein [Cytobacillus solani]USK52942.1 hypothetical protein LIS82_15030 [Cytobacillus solani]